MKTVIDYDDDPIALRLLKLPAIFIECLGHMLYCMGMYLFKPNEYDQIKYFREVYERVKTGKVAMYLIPPEIIEQVEEQERLAAEERKDLH